MIAIGTVDHDWRLASWLEEQLAEPTEVAMAPERVAARFPPADIVRAITSRGCSCDLLVRVEPATSPANGVGEQVSLDRSCRQTLARFARQVGTLRLFVGDMAAVSRTELPRLTMTLDQLASPHTTIPTESLVEVAATAPSRA